MAENSGKDFVVGAVIGAAVGAGLALLFAPKSGKELRGDINQGTVQVRDRASEWKDVAQAKGQEWKEIASEKGSELKGKTKEITSNVQSKIQDIRDKSAQEEFKDEVNEENAEEQN